MYVVTVEFVVRGEDAAAFRDAMIENATTSRAREPGCRQFDVCADPSDPALVFLYEVYDDRGAFDAHVASEHFRTFDVRVRPYVERKTVRVYERLDP